MNKKVKILLGILIIILIAVSIYITVLLFEKKKIEEEKKTVLNNSNSLVTEIKNICKKQKDSEEGTITSKYTIANKKLDHELKFDFTMPDSGVIEVDDECNIALSAVYGEYPVLKKYSSEIKLESLVYNDGDIVYFNPEIGELCNDYVEDNSLDGNTSGCLKWYTFNDSKDNNVVSLILDHNIVSSVRWLNEKDFKSNNQTDEYNNSLGSLTLNNEISNKISWKKDYRLPNLIEMLEIFELKIEDFKEDDIFFDSKQSSPLKSCYKGDVSKCNFSWLYDRTSLNCKEYGCSNNSSVETYGYWLEDASNNDKMSAFRIYHDGRITISKINNLSTGARVVIEIQKSLLQ